VSASAKPIGVDRVARWIAVAAWVWFTLAVGWGVFGRALSGHYGSAAGAGIIGENVLIWKIHGAYWAYTHNAPTKAEWFCHHPYGSFWFCALGILIFGHHDWVLTGMATVMASATAAMTWSIAKNRWGEVAGAAAACAWAVMPIALSFGNFMNHEGTVVFGLTLFFWGHDRMLATWKRRWLATSVAGVFVATMGDWCGFAGVGAVLGWGFVRTFLLPQRMTERTRMSEYARWWAIATAMAFLTAGFMVWSFRSADKLTEWLSSAATRGDDGMPLAIALKNRHTWIEAMFTPVSILLGKLALPVCAILFLIRRRDAEMYSLAAFVMAMFQYVFFKRGADVHIFWPYHFALYYAFAFAELAFALTWAVRFVVTRVSARVAGTAAAATGLAALLVPTIMMAPDSLRMLRYGRQTGGRFNNNHTGANVATSFRTEGDSLFVIGWLRQQAGKDVVSRGYIDTNSSQDWGWEYEWEWGGPRHQSDVPAQPLGPENALRPFLIARGSKLGAEGMKKLAAAGHVRAYSDVWVIDEREPAAPLDVYPLREHMPGLFEGYFFFGAEPARSIPSAPDPWLTWEMRRHLDIEPLPALPPEPDSLDVEQIRAAYNVAIDAGDSGRAEKLREKIDAQIDRTVSARYDDGTRLIGIRVTPTNEPVLEVWLEAGGPIKNDAFFDVKSHVLARNPTSTLPADDVERGLAFPPPIPTHFWKAGYIYHLDAVMLHRVGLERYVGGFTGGGPARVDSQPNTVLWTGY
jgi:hypothetical protein